MPDKGNHVCVYTLLSVFLFFCVRKISQISQNTKKKDLAFSYWILVVGFN